MGTRDYTIKSGDTLAAVATLAHVSLDSVLHANPGIKPEALHPGQVIKLPVEENKPSGTPVHNGSATGPIPGATGGSEGGGEYVDYSGPASHFPDLSKWAKYSVLWASNSKLMKYHDSDAEISMIKSVIETVARESNIDVRAILCMIMQESAGNVRVGTTSVQVTNPGFMQSHNGVSFDPKDPKGSILQMVRDGTEGTKSGDGLKQLLKQYGGSYYEAFRGYNSGTVNKADLNDPGPATRWYVRDIANRLMGHTWQGM